MGNIQRNKYMKKIIISLIALAMYGTECVAQTVSGKKNGHDYVDLGLPSGKLWATCNVGATQTTGKGLLYAWGETKPKTTYTWENYKWSKRKRYEAEHSMDDYENATTKVLKKQDDAATVNWGKCWRMPTSVEFMELKSGCEWTKTYDFKGSGTPGFIGTSKKNGNTIFLPTDGSWEDSYWVLEYSTTGEYTCIGFYDYPTPDGPFFGPCKAADIYIFVHSFI